MTLNLDQYQSKLFTRTVKGKTRSERRYNMPCPMAGCTNHRWLAAYNARKNEPCATCAQIERGRLGYAATLAKYGRTPLLEAIRAYQLANASAPELLIAGILDRLNVDYSRQIVFEGFILDFVVNHETVIEFNGDYWHSKRAEADARKKRAILAVGFKLAIFQTEDLIDLDQLQNRIAWFVGAKVKELEYAV